MSPQTRTAEARSVQPREPAGGLPRLLAGVGEQRAMTLAEHLAEHGPPPEVRGGRGRYGAEQLIDDVERAGLLGHGGAAFPTARKLRAVGQARGRAVVVVNAVEAEPASRKDRTLLELTPHLPLDGAVTAARAVGADAVVVCIVEGSDAAAEALLGALAERERGQLERFDELARLEVVTVPGHFVAGHETALVRYLNGGPAMPLYTPPLPFEHGVARRPSLIANVETLAHLALIARHGAGWFRELGAPAQPGSALVTLSGPLAYPGVYEIEHGASLASLLGAAGGATARLQGALVGGYGGAWIGAGQLSGLALSNEHLAPHGAALGAGVVVLLSADACPVAETARLGGWLASQSARQCGPCQYGLDALASAVGEIAAGRSGERGAATQRVERLAALVRRRGACRHPDGAVSMILSALEVFAAEFAEHARHGPCERCARPSELPLPVRPALRAEVRRRRGPS